MKSCPLSPHKFPTVDGTLEILDDSTIVALEETNYCIELGKFYILRTQPLARRATITASRCPLVRDVGQLTYNSEPQIQIPKTQESFKILLAFSYAIFFLV